MPDAEATARITTHLHRLNEELRESGVHTTTADSAQRVRSQVRHAEHSAPR